MSGSTFDELVEEIKSLSLDEQQRLREYGDFQTPDELAIQIVTALQQLDIDPASIIEPTIGILPIQGKPSNSNCWRNVNVIIDNLLPVQFPHPLTPSPNLSVTFKTRLLRLGEGGR